MKKLLFYLTFIFLFSLGSLAGLGNATYISIKTDTSVNDLMIKDQFDMNLSLVNSGDEAAFDVQVSLILPEGFSSENLFVGKLIPNKEFNGILNVNVSDNIKPGKYNLGVVTDYQDANNYGFSAISLRPIVIRKPTVSKLSCILSTPTLSKKDELKILIRNYDEEEHTVDVRLFLPRELKIDNSEVTIEVEAKSEKELTFEVENFAALPGSSYFVFASLNYEENGLHYSSVGSGMIEVVEEAESDEKGIRINPVFLLLVMIFLILLVVFLFLKFSHRT